MNKNEKVQYFGHGTRNETLSRMSEIDINLALYDPDILINRFALPQKIYDAMMIGCPLLVNREVQMSEELKEEELCYTASYADAKEIAEILNQIAKNKEKLTALANKLLSQEVIFKEDLELIFGKREWEKKKEKEAKKYFIDLVYELGKVRIEGKF